VAVLLFDATVYHLIRLRLEFNIQFVARDAFQDRYVPTLARAASAAAAPTVANGH
jgi:hypothetical protein